MTVAEAIQELRYFDLSAEVTSLAVTVKTGKRSTKLVYSARNAAKIMVARAARGGCNA